MKILELIKSLKPSAKYRGLPDFEAAGISCNSKEVGEGFIFVAIKGNRQDGNKFIGEAVARGAKVIVHSPLRVHSPQCPAVHSKKVFFVTVKDTRKALAQLAAAFYGDPSAKLKIAGITGTNGKTTITYLLEAMLKEAGLGSGVIGTIDYRFADKVISSRNTTPGPVELQGLLCAMLKSGAQYALMEVSSHALRQERTEGINFSSAIFTNLTQDHLDYHRTLENYFKSKLELFKGLNRRSFAVLNNDDPYSGRIKKVTRAGLITYAIAGKADVTAQDIKFSSNHTEFTLSAGAKKIKLKTPLIGKHNVYNILACVAWGLKEGLSPELIKSALEKFSSVPGRMEKIETGRGFSVFVDYAHTEDALKNALIALRQVSGRRIITVFGCGGERDKAKRPKMGKVVSSLADYAVITSDNPRSEEPLLIIADIEKGIKKNNYCVIPRRKEAIKKALSLARLGDIVLVAGKGHENYQVLKDRQIPFDDREAVKECLMKTQLTERKRT